MDKKFLYVFIFILILALIALQFKPAKQTVNTFITKPSYVNKKGLTVKERVVIAENYKRVVYEKGSFQEYLQNYDLKPYGSKVINYDGSDYFYQFGHIGVLDIPVPKNGLQQCADALIRIRSEYLWSINQKDKIGFNFTSGHYCSWQQYAKGYRPKVKGNKVAFHKTAKENSSKENFYNYLNLIYTYSGTISLFNEMKVKKNYFCYFKAIHLHKVCIC